MHKKTQRMASFFMHAEIRPDQSSILYVIIMKL